MGGHVVNIFSLSFSHCYLVCIHFYLCLSNLMTNSWSVQTTDYRLQTPRLDKSGPVRGLRLTDSAFLVSSLIVRIIGLSFSLSLSLSLCRTYVVHNIIYRWYSFFDFFEYDSIPWINTKETIKNKKTVIVHIDVRCFKQKKQKIIWTLIVHMYVIPGQYQFRAWY